MSEPSAKRLGKYELLEVLGDGTEGRVYKARCVANDVPGVAQGELVALKRLRPTGHDRESRLFQRQIEILRKLRHPNIIRYKDSFVWDQDDFDGEVYCLVTELLEGMTLKTLLEFGFLAGDIKDLPSLVKRLSQKLDPLSAYLYGRLDKGVHDVLARYQNSSQERSKLEGVIARQLNSLVSGQSIYEKGRFSDVILRPETEQLLKQRAQGEEIVRLNRFLLEDAYPAEVAKTLATNPRGLPWERARDILEQTLEAMQYAKTIGVVHRDLKPSNIYVSREGVAKLIDFGIARPENAEGASTSAAGLQGTLDYMAPEFARLQNFKGDEQSDIFSFGVCLYQVLTGRLPFPALGSSSHMALFQRWNDAATAPVVEYRHRIFHVLHRNSVVFISKCLELDRNKRFRSFDEALTEFKSLKPRLLQHRGKDTYEYLEYIGKGGFGRVFRGRRLSDGLEVAIKEMLGDSHATRFVREQKLLQKLGHEHLVKYLDFVEIKEEGPGDLRRFFLVMEYLKGMPDAGLRERIKRSKTGMDPGETLTLFVGYLECLDYLHRNKIIHRDIKPLNLYAPYGDPHGGKVFDLGIAYNENGTRTQGHLPGTLDYMPPEFATGKESRGEPQSDIYSIGVTLYQALTNALPFPHLEDSRALYQRAKNPVECAFNHSIFERYPELIGLISRALKHDPAQRYTSAEEMCRQIRKILADWKVTDEHGEAMSVGKAMLSKEDYAGAEHQARCALKATPDDPAATLLLEKALEGKNKKLFDAAMKQGMAAMNKQDYDEAERLACQAVLLKPRDVMAANLLRQAQENRNKKLYETAIRTGLVALRKYDYDEAEQCGQRALELLPGNQAAAELVGKAQEGKCKRECAVVAATGWKAFREGNLHGAEQYARQALKLMPGDQLASQLLGQVKEAKAKASYETAMEAARDALTRDNFEEVEMQGRRALELKPGDASAAALLQQVEHERNRKQKYDIAINNAARALQEGDHGRAELEAKRALGLKPEDARARQLLANAQRYKTVEKSEIPTLSTLEGSRETAATLPPSPETGSTIDRMKWIHEERREEEEYQKGLEDARVALKKRDYDAAERNALQALRFRPEDRTAHDLLSQAQKAIVEKRKNEAEERREQEYSLLISDARRAFKDDNLEQAGQLTSSALKLKQTREADDLLAEIQKAASYREAEKRREQEYCETVSDAGHAMKSRDFDKAEQLALKASQLKPSDHAAKALLSQVRKVIEENKKQEAEERLQEEYHWKISDAQAAIKAEDYERAELSLLRALEIKPNDKAAENLSGQLRRAWEEQRKKEAEELREQEYNKVLDEARQSLKGRMYDSWEKLVARALELKPHDAAAEDLLVRGRAEVEAQRRYEEEDNRQRKYAKAVADARQSLKDKDYQQAEQFAEEALRIKRTDETAGSLLAQAKNNRRKQQEDYQHAMDEARAAFGNQSLVTAATQARQALAAKPHDKEAEEFLAKVLALLRKRRNRTILKIAAVFLFILGCSVGGFLIWDKAELSRIEERKADILAIASTPPESFPLTKWSLALNEVESRAASEGRHADKWRDLANKLTDAGHQFPIALSNAFPSAIERRDLSGAEKLLGQWVQAQNFASSLGISAQDYTRVRNRMENDVHRLGHLSIVFTSNLPGTVISWKDGTLRLSAKENQIELPTGTNQITAHYPGLGDHTTNLVLEPGSERQSVDFHFAFGRVGFSTEPAAAEVRENGKLLGKTPFITEPLPGGNHTFALSNGDREASVTMNVPSDGTVWKTNILLKLAIGQLALDSDPAGAEVFFQGTSWGRLPLQTNLEAGEYHLTARFPGLSPEIKPIKVQAHGWDAYKFQFSYGKIYLTSEPDKAGVFFKGQLVGTTPFDSGIMASGKAPFRLSSAVHEWEGEVSVPSDGSTVTNHVAMNWKFGSVSVSSDPPGAEIWFENENKGVTPLVVRIPAGERQLTLRYRDLTDKVVTASVPPEGTVRAEGVFDYGNVTFLSSPRAQLFLKQKPVGNTPYDAYFLPPGPIDVRLELEDHVSTNFVVDVKSHHFITDRRDLQRGMGTLSLTCNLPGAKVRVDDGEWAPLPVDLPVEAGRSHHLLAVYKDQEILGKETVKMNEIKTFPFTFEPLKTWTSSEFGLDFVYLPSLHFWIGVDKVPLEQYVKVTGIQTNSPDSTCMTGVSWSEAKNFAEKLNRFGKPIGCNDWQFSLPTSGQWKRIVEKVSAPENQAGIKNVFSTYYEWCLITNSVGGAYRPGHGVPSLGQTMEDDGEGSPSMSIRVLLVPPR